VRLSLSALSAGRRRAVWAAGAVGIAVSLSVAIATVVGSFRETIVAWGNTAFTADFWVRPQSTDLGGIVGRLDPGIVETLRAQFGTESLDPFYHGRARFAGETIGLTGAEFAVVRRRGSMRFVDGREPRAVFEQAFARGEVVVNQAFGLRFDQHAGDVIRFEAAGRTLEKRIAGVFVDYGDSRGEIVLDGPEYRALFPADAPAQVALFLPDGQDRAAARRDFFAALGPDVRVEMVSVAEVRTRMLEVFEQTFAITRGMEVVAAAVAVIAVLTVLFALLAERRSEVGILRALGASSAQVGASIGMQAGLLGATGASAGACAGLGIGWLLVRVAQEQSFRWTIELHLPWLALAETLAGVTCVCAAAGLWPALVAARWSPREMLREAE
jgi:putative ABC transport system permease protein